MTIFTKNLISSPKQICFSTGNVDWIMKLTPEGVRFNHEAYPDLSATDMAKEIIDLLEKNFEIQFKKKS